MIGRTDATPSYNEMLLFAFQNTHTTCTFMDVPINEHKMEGPAVPIETRECCFRFHPFEWAHLKIINFSNIRIICHIQHEHKYEYNKHTTTDFIHLELALLEVLIIHLNFLPEWTNELVD